jgi:6-pyruvoyltetrahydropterin/6-carboxytetrahydropterin synthase
MPIVYLTRRATFCAGHRLFNPAFDEGKNRAIFGKCSNPNGHGHNYVLEVTVVGQPDPLTGMVMNLSDLDRLMEDAVIQKVDHRNLNVDVPEFRDVILTVENIAVVFWKMLSERLSPGLLCEIRLRETENNVAVYRGE